MYRWVLIAHGAWRWVVVAAGVALVVAALLGVWRRTAWSPATARLGRFFGIAVDIQVLMGATLYLVLSPLTNDAFSAAQSVAAGSDMQFFALRHALIMTFTLVAVHVSAVIVRRGRDDATRQRRAALCYGITLLILMSAIPWWRPWLRL